MKKLIVLLSLISTTSFANSISQINFDHINKGEDLLATCKYRTSNYKNGSLVIKKENTFEIYAHEANGMGSARFSYLNIKGNVLATRSVHSGKVVVSEIDLNLFDLNNSNKLIATTSSNGHYRASEEKRKVFSYISNGHEGGALEMSCQAAE